MRLATLILATLLAGAAGAQSPSPSAAVKPTVKMDAAKLIRRMEIAVAYLSQAASKPATGTAAPLSPKIRDEKPFFVALGKVSTGVQAIKSSYAAMSPPYFQALRDTSRSIQELKAARVLANLTDSRLVAGVDQLEDAHAVLDAHFGKTRGRTDAGGGLSEAEAKQLAALREKNEKLQAAIQALRDKTQGGGADNARVNAELEELLKLIAQVKAANGTAPSGTDPKTAEMLQALAKMDEALGRYGGLKKFLEQARPELAQQLASADAAAADANATEEQASQALPPPPASAATEEVDVPTEDVDEEVDVPDEQVGKLIGAVKGFATVAEDKTARDEAEEKQFEEGQKVKAVKSDAEPEHKSGKQVLEGHSPDED